MGKRIILIALAVLLLAVLLGEIGPRLVIGNNLERFEGEQLAFAAAAWVQTRFFLGGSAEPLILTAIRVEDVTEKAIAGGQKCYEAVVHAYTLFGLPWSSVLVSSCNNGSMVRQRWGLAPLVIGWPSN